MKIILSVIICSLFSLAGAQNYDIREYASFNLGYQTGQLRAVPVVFAGQEEPNLLIIHGEDADIDPFMGMFFFPTNTLKFAMYTNQGELLWRKELHRGNIPGMWFNPVFPFDLDQDGDEEIWFVYNTDSIHPLDIKKYKLTRMDPHTGEIEEMYNWKGLDFADYTMSQRYRHFILGGYDKGEPVLVTAQGTYTTMQLQGWNKDMSQRWDIVIGKEDKGSRSSHSCPVVDIDNDDTDEFFYGERCIDMGSGKQEFVCDENVYNGHSDVVAPTWDTDNGRWIIYTIRESGYGSYAPPRVVTYKDDGKRLWTDLESGHMDMGWVARIGPQGEPRALAVRIGGKTAGPDGFFRTGVEEFVYDPVKGTRVQIDFQLYLRLPVDINGDGIHELIGSGVQVDGKLLDHNGKEIYDFGENANCALLSKFLNKEGEQLLIYYPDGRVKIIYDHKASDTAEGRRRFESSNYRANQRLTAVGYNFSNLGGL